VAVAEPGNETDLAQNGLVIAFAVDVQVWYLQGHPYTLDRVTSFPHFTVPARSKPFLQTELAQAHISPELLKIPR